MHPAAFKSLLKGAAGREGSFTQWQPALEGSRISALVPAGVLVAGAAISDCHQLDQVLMQDKISPSHAVYRLIDVCPSARICCYYPLLHGCMW